MKNILLSFLALSLAASFSTDSSAQFYVYKGGEAVYTLKKQPARQRLSRSSDIRDC